MPPSTRYVAAFGVVTALTLLLLLRLVRRLTSSGRGSPTNGAERLALTGDVAAVVLLASSVVHQCVKGASLRADVLSTAVFGVAGLALVQGMGELGVRALFGASLKRELARGNMAAGVATCAHYVAMGVLAARATAGEGWYSLGIALAFFALAVVTHTAFVSLFRALTTYDDAEQIQGDNLAAALSYAGVSIAVSVLVARGVEGDFTTWRASLIGYGQVVALALALYPVRQLVVQGLWLGAKPTFRGGAIDRAVSEQRDASTAALEAGTYLASALAVAQLT